MALFLFCVECSLWDLCECGKNFWDCVLAAGSNSDPKCCLAEPFRVAPVVANGEGYGEKGVIVPSEARDSIFNLINFLHES